MTKEVLQVLDWLTCNPVFVQILDGREPRNNEDIANRLEDAKGIVRSHVELLEAAKRVLLATEDSDSSTNDVHLSLKLLRETVDKAEKATPSALWTARPGQFIAALDRRNIVPSRSPP
jgi:hypothetical protein